MQINDDFPPCDGVLTALVSYGTQDVWLQHHDTEFDMCNLLLNETGCRHKHVYTRLGTSKTVSSNSIVFVLNKTCDFINDVDLVIPNHNDALIDHLISYIKVEVNGCVLDLINGYGDIETQIRTNCSLLYRNNRTITSINGLTFVPLPMAPFHSHNVFKETTNTQNVIVSIGLKQYVDNDIGSWALFGKRYCIDNDNSILHKRHWFMTVQNQRTIPTKEHTVHLDFFNPINLIYFWGFQKSKVKAVTLLLNDRIYFEGPLQALEFLKISSGFGHLEPVVMFFSQNRFNERPHGSINFSRINNVKLCIDTDQLDFKIHVVGLNMQKISFDKDSYSVDFVMKNALISRLPQ